VKMALVIDTTCLHIYFPPFLCIDARPLDFVGYVSSANFYFLFYPSSTHVLALLQFLLYIYLLSPAECNILRVR
jgi:hypothetical protein